MKTWTDKIFIARAAAEEATGITPTCVVIRQEVWTELCRESHGEIFELDGMIVAVSDNLFNPFELMATLESMQE